MSIDVRASLSVLGRFFMLSGGGGGGGKMNDVSLKKKKKIMNTLMISDKENS